MPHDHSTNRCPAHSHEGCDAGRRSFLQGTAALLLGPALVTGCARLGLPTSTGLPPFQPCGPAARYQPRIKAAFVRRQGEYGIRWPGAVFDGEAAQRRIAAQVAATAKDLGVQLDLRPTPLHSLAESQTWVGEAQAAKADGLLVLLLDRQEHAWPTAKLAADSGLPTVVHSPLGTSFTTNTAPLADRPGCVIISTDDAGWLDDGLRMLAAGTRLRRARCVVIAGDRRAVQTMPDLGIQLQYVPANTFLDEYNALASGPEIQALTDDYVRRARRLHGATREDVVNGVKSYFVARHFLEREGADAITMDCLGALGKSKVSLPCIAWSRMNDDGIPAACEADLGAVASHMLVQYLFQRPGFQQDPVADTADDTVIGAHCSCATRLKGFNEPPEPFDLIHHHGNRDAVPRTLWPVGERVTCLDVQLRGREGLEKTELLISTGTVQQNIDVPPAGGCVVSVKVKFDGGQKVLSYPGFHQLFFLGDGRRQLEAFGQLFNLKARVV